MQCTLLFEWDKEKAESNLRKHRISFELAESVFVDPYALTEQDRIVDEEPRWRTIGLVGGLAVLFVAHTVREEALNDVIRIISARHANRRERIRYEENRAKNIG